MAHERPLVPHQPPLSARARRQKEEDEAKARMQRYVLWGGIAAGVLLIAVVAWAFRGAGRPPTGTTDPEAKLRLSKLFQLYRSYCTDNKKAPANEQALKDYYGKLSPEQKTAFGDNVDTLFVGPRDGEKYVVRYGVKVDPGGMRQLIIWEKNGQAGNRYVALSLGYVEEYDEETFKEFKKN
jgi:hypothetical protein